MMYDRYDHAGGNGFAWVFMLLMMALLFLGVVLLVRYLSRSAHSTNKSDATLEILNSRYAKGEIDKKEYDEKRKAIKE